jgi:histidinol-phosphatase (PHP family)
MFETQAHTRPFSPDALQSLDELVASASAVGFAGTVATEHMDPDLGQGEMWFDLDDFFAAMTSARSALPDGFRLLNGIEAGYQSHLADRYRDMTATHPFDHVIGSVHALRGDDIYFVQDV